MDSTGNPHVRVGLATVLAILALLLVGATRGSADAEPAAPAPLPSTGSAPAQPQPADPGPVVPGPPGRGFGPDPGGPRDGGGGGTQI